MFILEYMLTQTDNKLDLRDRKRKLIKIRFRIFLVHRNKSNIYPNQKKSSI